MRTLFVPALALCACGLPAMASSVLFSDLGPPGDAYNDGVGYVASGSGTVSSQVVAELFTAEGSGNLPVTQIDLAVGNDEDTLDTFYASIWTDNAGEPGAEVSGAYWSLSTSATFDTCCGLVTFSGITGVSLTGGEQYFMILGPLSLSDSSFNVWDWNNQGAIGDVQYSPNGVFPFHDDGPDSTLSAFDILSTPEPGSLFLLGTGLIGILGFAHRPKAQRA